MVARKTKNDKFVTTNYRIVKRCTDMQNINLIFIKDIIIYVNNCLCTSCPRIIYYKYFLHNSQYTNTFFAFPSFGTTI